MAEKGGVEQVGGNTIVRSIAGDVLIEAGPSGAVRVSGTPFSVDSAVAAPATGVKVTGNAAASGVAIAATSSGANENLTVDAKGTGMITLNPTATGVVNAVRKLVVMSNTPTPAGGTAGAGIQLGTTSNLGIFFGSGAPTLAAAQGALYIRTDGSSTSTRLYVNTNGSTTWTNVTTAA